MSAGHEVRPINPHFVKPFVRGSNNNAVDAEAIFDAASRPTMRFVPVKTDVQQDLQSLHRVRDRLIAQRTSLLIHVDLGPGTALGRAVPSPADRVCRGNLVRARCWPTAAP